jgi:hypothetical protein
MPARTNEKIWNVQPMRFIILIDAAISLLAILILIIH